MVNEAVYTFRVGILKPTRCSIILTWLAELGSTRRGIYPGAVFISHKISSCGNVREDLLAKTGANTILAISYQLFFSTACPNTMEERVCDWCSLIIGDYSSAKITFPTDLLHAVSALARLFADELCSPYLVGLWLEVLWCTLSWYPLSWHSDDVRAERGRRTTLRPPGLGLPSTPQ